MKTKLIIALSLGIFFLMVIPALAEDIDDPISMPGQTRGTATLFEITDSEYLNVSLESSEEITVLLESVPKTISLIIEASSISVSTTLTISNLEPNKSYYKYDNSYKNEVEFVSDEHGKYTWTQDLTQSHHVWFQEAGGTIFLPDDCDTYGTWDSGTSTCTFAQDLTESVEIAAYNITLDCNGYSITGAGSGYGIYLNRKNYTTIKNCIISNFNYGTYLVFSSNYNVITSNTANNNSFGIHLVHSMYNTITFNMVNNNFFGISLGSSPNNTLIGNDLTNNNRYSIWDDGGYGCNYIDDLSNIGGDGKPILYKHDTTGSIVENTDAYSEIIFCNVDNSLIDNVTISNPENTGDGIILVFSDNNTVENSNLSNDYIGISIHFSSGNTVINNTTNSNDENGIRLYASSNNTLINNTVNNNEKYGISLVASSNDNTIYHNNFIDNETQAWDLGGISNLFDNSYPGGGNYWSDYVGIDQFSGPNQDQPGVDGIGDTHYTFTGGQDNYPFMVENGWEGLPPVNQPPTFSNLGQFKSDGVTAISEGGTTTESIVVFKAIVNDPDNDKAKLQVQIKEDDQEWQDIMESDFVDSGSEAIITKYGLIEAQYRWRARAADERGGMSEWQEFGTPENVDFEVKIVPLYTQVVSSYPSEEATRFWFNEYYARGDIKPYFCGSRIYQCGCAITSVVMIARYYDVVDANGKDVNPGEINEWLKNEPGGYLNGDANWIAAAKYTGYRIKYEKTDKITNNYALLDEKLNNNQPVIAKANAGRGGINRKHFFVIDDKSASTYTVKDPAWYNTKILNEGISDDAQHIRNYENGFDGLRIYKKGDGIAQSAIALALGSPAELLVTDSLGRKLGKDPITGIEYNEIPDAWYFEDGFDDPTGETPPSQERNKLIQILEPVDGEYNIQVIGTGTGSYTMNLSVYDETGESKDIAKEGETTTDNIQEFTLGYSAETVEEVEFHKIVDIDIKPGSDPNTINLKSKGVTPVAILTDEFFDAKDIVLNSIILAGASPTKGKLEDVDNDGDLDLILHFETQSLQLISGDTEATLTGELKDGTLIEGTDFIRIISTKK